MKYPKSIEEFFDRQDQWKTEVEILRKLILSMKLEETFKWSFPVYTHEGKNIVGIGSFKSYFGLWFFQGGLLEDAENKLMNAQKGKTKAMRQWRFSDKKEIDKKLIKAYIKETIANFQAGKEIKPALKKPLVIPEELAEALKKNKKAAKLFEAMSLSKKRDYAEHISKAKRAETKEKRITKIIPMILENKGLNDKYKK